MGSYVSKDAVTEMWDQVMTSQVATYACAHPFMIVGSLAVGFVLWDWFGWVVGPKMPPGPLGLPFLGNLHQLSEDISGDFMRMGAKYGDIFTVRFAFRPVIVLNDYELIKEVFIHRGVEFANRPKDSVLPKLMNFKDEVSSQDYSPELLTAKKFALKALRSFGVGTNALDERMETEITKICDAILARKGASFDFHQFAMKGASNVIHSVLFDAQWSFDDPKLERAVELVNTSYACLMEAYMWNLLPPWLVSVFGRGVIRRCDKAFGDLREFLQEMIDEHRKTFDPENLRDFIDVYLKERPDLDDRVLKDTIMAFQLDAVHSMGMILTWATVSILHRPEVHKKICEELDSVVGRSRRPTSDDRKNLPYMEAVLLEMFRVSGLLPVSVEHRATEHTTLRGYTIPKDVAIMANNNAVHFDPKLYPEPHEFKPERFLSEDGKFTAPGAGGMLIFGAGPRSCVGERLAKQEIFLIVANMFHRFNLKFAEGEQYLPIEIEKNKTLFSMDLTTMLRAEER